MTTLGRPEDLETGTNEDYLRPTKLMAGGVAVSLEPSKQAGAVGDEEVIRIHSATGLRVVKNGAQYVLMDGDQVILSTRVETLALVEFEELRNARIEPAQRRREAERAAGDLRALKAEFFGAREANARSGKGRGGRGGV